jgi:hypothetical protein
MWSTIKALIIQEGQCVWDMTVVNEEGLDKEIRFTFSLLTYDVEDHRIIENVRWPNTTIIYEESSFSFIIWP